MPIIGKKGLPLELFRKEEKTGLTQICCRNSCSKVVTDYIKTQAESQKPLSITRLGKIFNQIEKLGCPKAFSIFMESFKNPQQFQKIFEEAFYAAVEDGDTSRVLELTRREAMFSQISKTCLGEAYGTAYEAEDFEIIEILKNSSRGREIENTYFNAG